MTSARIATLQIAIYQAQQELHTILTSHSEGLSAITKEQAISALEESLVRAAVCLDMKLIEQQCFIAVAGKYEADGSENLKYISANVCLVDALRLKHEVSDYPFSRIEISTQKK